jgi:hypothetical protein
MKKIFFAISVLIFSQTIAQTDVDNFYARKFRLNADYGYSYRIAETADDVPAYMKGYVDQIRGGWNYNFGVYYFLIEQMGVGAKYCYVTTDFKGTIRTAGYGNIVVSEKINTTYIAPGFQIRTPGFDRWVAHIGLNMGYLGYVDDAVLNGNPYLLEGSTFGLDVSLGAEVRLFGNVNLGVEFVMLAGALSEAKENGITKTIDPPESLSRVDFNIGVRSYF